MILYYQVFHQLTILPLSTVDSGIPMPSDVLFSNPSLLPSPKISLEWIHTQASLLSLDATPASRALGWSTREEIARAEVELKPAYHIQPDGKGRVEEGF
jgi:hypothetical protein